MKKKALMFIVAAACAPMAQAVDYTWTGLGDGATWADTGNWDVNGVPMDDNLARPGLSLPVGDKVVFAGATMPTDNPGIDSAFDSTNSGKWSVPVMEFNSGGSTIDFVHSSTHNNGMFTNLVNGVDRQIWTVGDGITGGTEDVVVNITNGFLMMRHPNGVHRFTVNADGTLNIGGNLDFQYNASRYAVLTINGGAVAVNGVAVDLTAANPYVEFTAIGGTFTAAYGGSFADFAAVESAMGPGGAFRSSDPFTIGLEATDNGTGFTVTAIVPPPPNYWTGSGGATWDNVTPNFTLNGPGAPLSEGSLDAVKALPSDKVTFGDEYFFNNSSSPVAQTNLTTVGGGVEIANVDFTNNSSSYTVTSPGFDGIKGATTVSVLGTAPVTLLGIHSYSGNTQITSGSTLTVGDLTTNTNTINSSAAINNAGTLNLNNIAAIYGNSIVNSGALNFTTTASLSCPAAITGTGTVQKLGAGTLTIPANSAYNGATTVSEGTLKFTGNIQSDSITIESGAVLELNNTTGAAINYAAITYSGTGILRKTGPDWVRWTNTVGTFALGSGALIDVQQGNFNGGANANEDWTNNFSDLHVASGAIFSGSEANIRFNVLTGSGTISSGYNGAGYVESVIGVANGSGTFDGIIENNGIPTRAPNLVKIGSGTQTFTGLNTHTGNTTVEEGAITIAATSQVVMRPTSNGVSNLISGTTGNGTINLDGALNIDLSAADPTPLNSWELINDDNLTVNFGATFNVTSSNGAFTETNPGLWTLDDGIYAWYFDEATGTLTYGTSNNAKIWTGDGGATWDASTTPNFSNNLPVDPLSNVTFDVATASTNAAQFADVYFANGSTTSVTQTNVSIAAGGVSTGLIEFFNNSLSFTVHSNDANGIAGATDINLRGGGSVTLTGTHATTGNTTVESGNSLNLGDGSTDGSIASSAIANNGFLTFTNGAAVSHDGVISGSGSLDKLGAGTLTLSAANTFNGATTITDGTLVIQDNSASNFVTLVSPTSVLDINYSGALLDLGAKNYSGSGILRKTGPGTVRWGNGALTVAMSADAKIEVLEGVLVGGSFNNDVWTGNFSDLHVAAGATFNGAEANVEVDVLTGAGTITSGSSLLTYFDLTFGSDYGTGTFDGVLADNPGAGNRGNYRKVGTGTQTLTGMNTYTGDTNVEDGTLVVTSTGGLTALPEASGVNNQVTGTASGTLDFDGVLFIDLSIADATWGNVWPLIGFGPTVNLGANFNVNSSLGAFTQSGTEWSLDTGGNLWTFDETTGELTVEEGTALPGYANWLTLYPGLTNTAPDADPEFDGIENVLEYVLNGNPEVSDTGILPTLDASGANFVFSFTRWLDSESDTTQTFQYGSDLTGWNDINITSPADPEVAFTPIDAETETVTITIPKGAATKLFGRLKAEFNP